MLKTLKILQLILLCLILLILFACSRTNNGISNSGNVFDMNNSSSELTKINILQNSGEEAPYCDNASFLEQYSNWTIEGKIGKVKSVEGTGDDSLVIAPFYVTNYSRGTNLGNELEIYSSGPTSPSQPIFMENKTFRIYVVQIARTTYWVTCGFKGFKEI